MEDMNRSKVVKRIAEELLDYDILDTHNFSSDTKTLIECVQAIILSNLQDYIIISGRIL